MKKFKIGYTQGVYDMFHIGHLNLLKNAKKYCETLIVGVNSDKLVQEYKGKKTVIRAEDRRTIVENIKVVDKAIITDTLDKLETLEEIGYNAIFIGDDWKESPRWIKTKKELSLHGVEVVFLPYTEDISSTKLRTVENEKVNEYMPAN